MTAGAGKKSVNRKTTGGFGSNDSDILSAIDSKFEELEQTVILAALVPQLHDRLHVVEQMLKIQNAPNLQNGEADAKLRKSDAEIHEEHFGPISAEPEMGPKWGDDVSPQCRAPRGGDDYDDCNAPLSIQSNGATDVKNAAGLEGLDGFDFSDLAKMPTMKHKSTQKITELSRSKIKGLDEKTLDTQTTELYTFGESTWDLVMFIGTGALGPLGSFQTVVLAIVNVLMQVVFVAIAYYNFMTPDIGQDSVLDILRWRRSSGHSMSDYSSESKESLVHRVCKEDKSLASSGIQVALLENINKYLKLEAGGLEGFFTGQILCIVALVCWYLMVAKEVSHALALHRGIMAAPRGPTKIDTRENPFTQAIHYRLRSVARRRKLFSGFLLMYRLLAAVLLVIVGTAFLVYTVSVTELILNAVALGIILDIDDLLFDALATTPGRHLVHQLDPLPMPSMPRIRGADAKSVFMSIFIPVLTVLVYYLLLDPFVGTLTSVKGAMCGGNQNFVWDIDKRRIVHLSPTLGGGWEEEEGSIKSEAIMEGEKIGHGLSIDSTSFGVWVSDVTVLSDLATADLDDLIEDSNVDCGDLGNSGPWLSHLRFLLGNESIESCADAVPYCASFTKMPEFAADDGRGFSARMLCSETCGCRNPGGHFVNVQGCPYYEGECMKSDDFVDHIAGGLCVERDASALMEFASWKEWIRAIRSYGSHPSDLLGGKEDALILAQAMEDHGCGFLANLSAQNLTLGGCFSWSSKFDWEFKTLEFFCPETCGCWKDVPAQSSCPRPFGKQCSELEDSKCLTWNEQHFCPGINAEVIFTMLMITWAPGRMQDSSDIKVARKAFQEAFAQNAGHTEPIDPATVLIDLPWDYPHLVYGRVYLTDPQTMNKMEMTSSLYSSPLQDYQAALNASLISSGVDLDALGLILTFAGDPTGPYGGYGYAYGAPF